MTKSLQAQADSECDKFGKKAHFDRYEDETLLGPRTLFLLRQPRSRCQ